MDGFHLKIDPLIVVPFLFWGVVVAGTIMAAGDRYILATVRDYWRYMAIGILVTLAWRIPANGTLFHGMEYEDAYVYTVAARQMAHGKQISEEDKTYLTTVCAVGSLAQCQSTTTYSGHYIGSSYVFGLATRLLGYTPVIATWVSIAAACISLLVIFVIARMLSDEPAVPIFSAAVFAMTPVFSVYGAAAYAEPLSNLFSSIAVLACLRYLHSYEGEKRVVAVLASLMTWGFALLFAILVKRENLVLAFALPTAYLARIILHVSRPPHWRGLVTISGFSLISVVFAIFVLRFSEVLASETAEYNEIPFGLNQVRSLLPAFAISFATPSWYCFGLVWVLYGLIVKHGSNSRTIYPVLVLLGYLSLYVFHIRSYYQLNYDDVMPVDALRYSMNFMTMWALLAGVGLTSAVTRFLSCTGRWTKSCLVIAGLVYSIIAYGYTKTLHERVTSEEQYRRVEPAIVAGRLAAEMGTTRTYVLTLEPLLVQIYAAPTVNVIEMTRVDEQLIMALASPHSGFTLIYIDHETYRNEIDRNRFRAHFEFLNRFRRESLYKTDSFELIKLNSVHS